MSKKSLIIAGFILVLALVVIYILSSKIFPKEEETETMYCGENNSKPVKVFKYPTKAFPTFVKEYTSKISASIDIVDSLERSPAIKGSGSVDLTNKVVELREKLNQESARMEMVMKSNFFAYNSNPCDSEISKNYYALLNLIVEKNGELEKFRAELTEPVNKGSNKASDFKIVTDTATIKDGLNRLLAEYKFEK